MAGRRFRDLNHRFCRWHEQASQSARCISMRLLSASSHLRRHQALTSAWPTCVFFWVRCSIRAFVIFTNLLRYLSLRLTFPAIRYGIAGLKHLARAKFASQMAVHYTSEEFADAIQDVYDSTVDEDRGLRDIVIQTFREYPELVQRKDVEYAVKDTPSLAWELFRVGWGLPIY